MAMARLISTTSKRSTTAASLSIFTTAGPTISTSTTTTNDSKSNAYGQTLSKEEKLRNHKRTRSFKHWIVTIHRPTTELTRDKLIHIYVKTLAKVVGSEDEAKMRIYQAHTRVRVFAARISWEKSRKLNELPWVQRVSPDLSPNCNYKTNEGELVIDEQVVSYDEAFRNCKLIGGKDGDSGIQPHNIDLEKTRNEWDLFMDNVLRCKRKYKSFEHMMRMFEIFKYNLKKIDELNCNSKDGFSYELTCSFDQSPEEIERSNL